MDNRHGTYCLVSGKHRSVRTDYPSPPCFYCSFSFMKLSCFYRKLFTSEYNNIRHSPYQSRHHKENGVCDKFNFCSMFFNTFIILFYYGSFNFMHHNVPSREYFPQAGIHSHQVSHFLMIFLPVRPLLMRTLPHQED